MQKGEVEQAIAVLQKMKAEALQPDATTYSILIDGCVANLKVEMGLSLFEEATKLNFPINRSTFKTLLEACVKVNRLDTAFSTFQAMKEATPPDSVIISALINGCVKQKKKDMMEEAVGLFQEMKAHHMEPDKDVYNSLIEGYFLKWPNHDKALALFEEMKSRTQPNLVTFNILIQGCAENQQIETAFSFFKEMESMKIKPDQGTYTRLIDGCVATNRMDLMISFVEELKRKGTPFTVALFGLLVNGCMKANQTEMATNLYAQMEKEGVRVSADTFNVLISGFMRLGDYKQARHWRAVMQKTKVRPNAVTISILDRLKILF